MSRVAIEDLFLFFLVKAISYKYRIADRYFVGVIGVHDGDMSICIFGIVEILKN